MILKIENELNKEFLARNKRDDINDQFYSEMRSMGAARRLYNLVKIHKAGTPLRPVLSLPGSSYKNFNKIQAKFFDKVDRAYIGTNTKDVRETFQKLLLIRMVL